MWRKCTQLCSLSTVVVVCGIDMLDWECLGRYIQLWEVYNTHPVLWKLTTACRLYGVVRSPTGGRLSKWNDKSNQASSLWTSKGFLLSIYDCYYSVLISYKPATGSSSLLLRLLKSDQLRMLTSWFLINTKVLAYMYVHACTRTLELWVEPVNVRGCPGTWGYCTATQADLCTQIGSSLVNRVHRSQHSIREWACVRDVIELQSITTHCMFPSIHVYINYMCNSL